MIDDGSETGMSVIKINAITVPSDSGDELARRFAGRAGAVDGQPGFEGFELLKPTDGRDVWLVLTRWADEASFQAWTASRGFAEGHRSPGDAGAAPHGAGDDASSAQPGHEKSHPGESCHPGPAGQENRSTVRSPLAISAELWSYEVAGGSASSGR